MPTNDPSTRAVRPSTTPPSHVRWIGGIDGHLEIFPQHPPQATPLLLNSAQHIRDALHNPETVDESNLGPVAAFGMFLAAREVPATSQAALLVDTLCTAAASFAEARAGVPAIQMALSTMLESASHHRGIGVRQLQVRLLQEASMMLPPAP